VFLTNDNQLANFPDITVEELPWSWPRPYRRTSRCSRRGRHHGFSWYSDFAAAPPLNWSFGPRPRTEPDA